MEFQKYQHIESNLEGKETQGLLCGKIILQPKLDGSNCQMWMEGDELIIASRNNILSPLKDNQNCYKTLIKKDKYRKFFKANPHFRLAGEWMVSHKIKYIDEAYYKFYVFDVIYKDADRTNREPKYLHYEVASPLLYAYEIEAVPYRFIEAKDVLNKEKLFNLPEAKFLLREDADGGEGVVLKNYNYINPFGRSTWCKIVNHDVFKMKRREPKERVSHDKEDAFVAQYLTDHLFDKCYHKINDIEEFQKKHVSKYVRSCQHEFYEDFCKEITDPEFNYKVVNNKVAALSVTYLRALNII